MQLQMSHFGKLIDFSVIVHIQFNAINGNAVYRRHWTVIRPIYSRHGFKSAIGGKGSGYVIAYKAGATVGGEFLLFIRVIFIITVENIKFIGIMLNSIILEFFYAYGDDFHARLGSGAINIINVFGEFIDNDLGFTIATSGNRLT